MWIFRVFPKFKVDFALNECFSWTTNEFVKWFFRQTSVFLSLCLCYVYVYLKLEFGAAQPNLSMSVCQLWSRAASRGTNVYLLKTVHTFMRIIEELIKTELVKWINEVNAISSNLKTEDDIFSLVQMSYERSNLYLEHSEF